MRNGLAAVGVSVPNSTLCVYTFVALASFEPSSSDPLPVHRWVFARGPTSSVVLLSSERKSKQSKLSTTDLLVLASMKNAAKCDN